MSNSGRKTSTPGWCTFAALGVIFAVASASVGYAEPPDTSKKPALSATHTQAKDGAQAVDPRLRKTPTGAPASLIQISHTRNSDTAGIVASKLKSKNSLPSSLTTEDRASKAPGGSRQAMGPALGACCQDGACIGDTPEGECEGNWNPNASCTGINDLPLPVCNASCFWDNGPPLDDFGSPASQCAPDYPFVSAAADDFILKDSGDNPCLITAIRAWVTHFNGAGTPADYDALIVTVYADADPKGPAGMPEDLPVGDCAHSGVIIAQETVDPFFITAVETIGPCAGSVWQLDFPVNFELEKNVKYWLEIQPVMNFGGGLGQIAWQLSQNSTGHNAQSIFPLLEITEWTEIDGNDGVCAESPPADTRKDLAFQLFGVKCDLDGECEPAQGEDPCTCEDCVVAEPCGDGFCCPNEDCESCEEDCGACPFCGDGVINQPNEECEPPFVFLCESGKLCDENCECPGGPENDDCEDRSEILDGLTPFSTIFATTDGLPMPPGADCNDFGSTQTWYDIWFNYTATCSGVLKVTTCEDEGGSATYDTDLAMYTAGTADCVNDIPCPPTDDFFVSCNDDDAQNPCGDVPGGLFHSTMRDVPVTAGVCYKIRVGSWQEASTTGTGVLNIECTVPECGNGIIEAGEDCDPPDPNGACADADCDPVTCLCPPVGACCDGAECIGDTLVEECEGNWNPNASCTGANDLPLPVCNDGCTYDNGLPLDDFGSPGSQCAQDYPFQAGTADDFILKDSLGDNPCLITAITAYVTFFNDGGNGTPANFQGINITVYEDADPTKGPAGMPIDDGTCDHSGVLVQQFVPAGGFAMTPLATACTTNQWQLDIPVDFQLPKNTKLWLEIQPQQDFDPFGQTAVVLSQSSNGHPAQQIFELLGGPVWNEIDGNASGCDESPPAGTRRDVAFKLFGEKIGVCDFDKLCEPENGENSCNCPSDCGVCGGGGAAANAECIQGVCCGDGVIEGHETCDFAKDVCGDCVTDGPVSGPDLDTGAADLGWVLGNWGSFVDNPSCAPAGTACPADLICLDDLAPQASNQDIGPEEIAKITGRWGCCCDNPDVEKCSPYPAYCGFGFGDPPKNQCEEADCVGCECLGRGACCDTPGAGLACLEELTEDECDAEGGTYNGDDTACGDCPACGLNNEVLDPGFEGGTPNAIWTETSTNFGTPLCDPVSCTFGGGTGPHSGSWWAFFGGIVAFEDGTVSQSLTIPAGQNTLSFWTEYPVCSGDPADFLEATIDGIVVFTALGTDPLCDLVGYVQQVVDISAFADGGVHTLEFHSTIFAVGGLFCNFFVDDVCID